MNVLRVYGMTNLNRSTLLWKQLQRYLYKFELMPSLFIADDLLCTVLLFLVDTNAFDAAASMLSGDGGGNTRCLVHR